MYGIENVVGDLRGMAELPTTLARTYLEHFQLRMILDGIRNRKIATAAEFGCGYGRMLPVLSEYSHRVHGFERDGQLCSIAQKLWPHYLIRKVETLADTGYAADSFDLVVTWTVLQHLQPAELPEVCREISMLTKSGGLLIVCEEIEGEGPGCYGRIYDEYFPKFSLINRATRMVENERASGKISVYVKN